MDNKHCRFCGKKLETSMVDLGVSPLSNEYVMEEKLEQGQTFYPLKVMVCEKCKLAQAMVFEKPENIFSDYKYFSSYSQSWLDHCKKYVDMIVQRLELDENSTVYEIASNDGYLLQYFLPYKINPCGIEPAENVAEIAKRKGIDVEIDFWNEKTAETLVNKRGKADLILGNNVLAHVPDINSFVEGLKIALTDTGTITIEFPHLLNLMQFNQFDTIYHEHFSYLSLITVTEIFNHHRLKIYDVQKLNTHGGSLRIYATHKENNKLETSNNVKLVLEEEKQYGLHEMKTYESFAEKIKKIKLDSCKLLIDLKQHNKKVVAFGAAAKGNTFLNYCGIGREYIDFVCDSSEEKQGLFLPGTRIPIYSPRMIAEEKPDYIIFLAWNLRDEFVELLEYTRAWGCKFITFIPEVEIF